MARYIDADKARSDMKKMPLGEQLIDSVMRFVIDRLPTADVSEIVRCKDCTRRNGYGCPAYIGGVNLDDEDFCSFGEKGASNELQR